MTERRELELVGRLQGVGFRPFAFRLACSLELSGFVRNTPHGVLLEVQGSAKQVGIFEERLRSELPPHARIRKWGSRAIGLDRSESPGEFRILPSAEMDGVASAEVLPDLATCADCLREIRDPRNRRFRYPFANCTHCGPRYSILERLPYDRVNTTMQAFRMCAKCQREFEDPSDRRFHAQPNCCPDCGPSLTLKNSRGEIVARRDEALLETARLLRSGQIVAVQGIGGFHLLCDAALDSTVVRLRVAKRREHKPFAVLFPSLEAVRQVCEVSEVEARLLCGSEAPITLLKRRAMPASRSPAISGQIAPGIPSLGVLLPYTPLYHLLAQELGVPLVATSGNRSEEPICLTENEARGKLGDITEFFLIHDRPIACRVDDSVVREIAGEVTVLRAARGYAPLLLDCRALATRQDTIGVGAHQKCAIALLRGDALVMGPHIGDLDTLEATQAHREAIDAMRELHAGSAHDQGSLRLIADLHPDYRSAHTAEALDPRVRRVQHHHAHVLSCMAEHSLDGQVLGVAWDGSGYGPEGNAIWGGECLLADRRAYTRLASFRPFPLPGGEQGVKEPWRAAAGLLFEAFGESALNGQNIPGTKESELRLIHTMLQRQLNCPRTSSVGRLFDGVAAILGLRRHVDYSGQAAVELEYAVTREYPEVTYEVPIEASVGSPSWILDWAPMLRRILRDRADGVSIGVIAARFHATLAQSIVELATRLGETRVVLSGGCFQNRVLSELAIAKLRERGISPYWHHRVPPNDGGIAVGQVFSQGGP